MARIPAPNEIKILNGEKNKERLNKEYLKVDKYKSIPKPPMKINPRANEFYNRYCKILIANSLLTDMDLIQVCHLSLLDAYIESRFEDNEAPAAAYIALTKSISADFGLNVISREKIPSKTESNSMSKWEKRRLKKRTWVAQKSEQNKP